MSNIPATPTEVVSRVDNITKKLIGRHQGEEIRYTVCQQNGCWTSCLLACHVREGELVAIDVGDPIHSNMPREEVGETAIRQAMIQQRPCVRGRMWRKTLYHPQRARYPLKNVGKRGDPEWKRISWDEALDTLAGKIQEIVSKYGPYSIHQNILPLPFGPYAGFGYMQWGMSSYSGHQLADNLVMGFDDVAALWGLPWGTPTGTEAPDLLNSKLIIGVGWNPAINYYEYTYYMALAKERGIPIIIVDPRCTPSVQAYADQWIPIRPGTDMTFLLALANVLFKEDLIDHAFVDRFVEPQGFASWRAYVLGEEDGVDKTPEWAEPICAVPAETIRALARFYGQHHGYSKGNSCYFKVHWATARQVYGENQARAGMYLQAMTGNIGVPGGCFSGGDALIPPYTPIPQIDWKRGQPKLMPRHLMYVRGWTEAVLWREKFDRGEISEDEYRHRIGAAKDWPLPDIHMVFNQVGTDLGYPDNQRLWEAYKKVDFVVKGVYHLDRPEVRYADLVLPVADCFFEDPDSYFGLGGFFFPSLLGMGPVSNFFVLTEKIIEPPGEAKPAEWIHTQLACRLGVGESYSPRLVDVLDDPKAWDARFRELQREAWENWRPVYAQWAAKEGVEPGEAPPFDEFIKRPLFRVPLKREPYYAFRPQIQEGQPFDTASGRIEFYSSFLADPDMPDKEFILPRSEMPTGVCYGGDKPVRIPPKAEYVEPWDSPLSAMAGEFPLRLITPHSFFRQHTSQDNNLWMEDEARHALWISVPDAKARGIRDGDLVRVFNPKGEAIMPAYVTSRIAPGTICIIYGAWYRPSQVKSETMPDGIDVRGAANNFTPAEHFPWVNGASHCSHLAQVQKLLGGSQR